MKNRPPQRSTVSRSVTRRGALRRLAAVFSAGLWPGAVSAAAETSRPMATRPIRFVVANDFHHRDAACDPWLEALFRQIAATPAAAFCLGLGDLADAGDHDSLRRMARLATAAGLPFHPTPGNHDLDQSPVDGFYAEVFPQRRNYTWSEAGWRFVLIDTTEGKKWDNVVISPATLAWLDANLPTLDPREPTVLATHFPLAAEVKMCPVNAEAVLARFLGFNLRGVFGGHFHGRTAFQRGDTRLMTNACVSRVRGNHDGTTEKGYWVCDGTATGILTTEFVPFDGTGAA